MARAAVQLVVLLALLGGVRSFAQPGSDNDAARIESLRAVIAPVRTIDPGDPDCSDLEPLRAIVGDARVVMLGESSHGDAGAFLAKTRMIRFLHERMGFDVLVWESGLWECREVARALARGVPAREALPLGVLDLWSASAECGPLMDLLDRSRRSPRPIAVAGMDDTPTGTLAGRGIVDAALAFCDAADPALAPPALRAELRAYDAWLASLDPRTRPEEPRSAIDALLLLERRIDSSPHAARAGGESEAAFVRRALLAAAGAAQRRALPPPISPVEEFRRSTAMAEHLRFLADEVFAGRRLVVWAHNVHLARQSHRATPVDAPRAVAARERALSTGHLASLSIKGGVRAIMVTGYAGAHTLAWGTVAPVAPAPDGSLEALLHGTGAAHALLDLRPGRAPAWLEAPLLARETVFWSERAVWPVRFDGVFFNDAIVPTTRVPDADAGR